MIIATRESEAGNEAILRLVDRRTPMVVVGREFVHDKVDRITAGYELGGYAATCHLLSLGHRRIAFIGVAIENGAALSRFQGCLRAHAEAGVAVCPEWGI